MPFYKSQVTHWYNLSIINNMEKFICIFLVEKYFCRLFISKRLFLWTFALAAILFNKLTTLYFRSYIFMAFNWKFLESNLKSRTKFSIMTNRQEHFQ